jgi:hypothetical protein
MMSIENQIQWYATKPVDALEAAQQRLKDETRGQALTGVDKDTAYVLREALKLARMAARLGELV